MSNIDRLRAVIAFLNKANNENTSVTYAIVLGYLMSLANEEQVATVEQLAIEAVPLLAKKDN